MRLTVRLLMRIYQGASLSWHWSAGVLATVVFGSLLRREGLHVNHKRVYRLYHLSGLGVKRRRRRKGLATERLPLLRPAAPNLTWSMDFVMDALSTGRRIKCLTCVDDFTKECLTVTVAFGISGVQVTRILDSIALFRGYPATIRTDQGPEFTCRALDQWAFEHVLSCA
ncbi:Integrase core domain [Kluyvera cryocrescens]|uniref:Integrase core domain n=1 Tax=Kluyvera cryocrescens TaxID=580 RepID=A0A485ASP4_KLUCR|nr:Integrase core domain [Kluyvera cryocrescens]